MLGRDDSDFLLRSLRTGTLAPGKIKAVHDSFYASTKHCPAAALRVRLRPLEAHILVR